jgi:hypothetical protein
MQFALSCLTAIAAYTMFAGVAFAQSARDIRGPSPLVAIENEPPATLIVDRPLAAQLAQGLVFNKYRTEPAVVPVFGKGAPRRVTAHRSRPYHRRRRAVALRRCQRQTVVAVGLPPGSHKVLFEMADPTHRVIDSKTVSFEIPTHTGAR